MSLQGTIYIAVGLTFALYVGIAIWSRARSTKDFYVAGGNINPVMNGMATAADWMSAASFISMAGMIMWICVPLVFFNCVSVGDKMQENAG